MKKIQILMSGSFALGFASLALAQGTPVYVTGSTAFRSAVITQEYNVLNNGAAASAGGPGVAAVSGSDATKAQYSVVHGVDTNGNEVTFYNSFTGSTAGEVDLCSHNLLPEVNPANVPAYGTASVTSVTNLPTSDLVAASQVPELAFDDAAAADNAAILLGSNAAGIAASNAITSAGPVDAGVATGGNPVASINFEWILGSIASTAPTTASPIANITQDQAAVLLQTGQLQASIVTGNPSDSNAVLLYVGRNEDSGTRILYTAESFGNGVGNKFGLGVAAPYNQYMVTQSGVSLPLNADYPLTAPISAVTAGITAVQQWPKLDNNGTGWAMYSEATSDGNPLITWKTAGHSGYDGGGDVGNILASPNPVTGVTGTPSPYTKVYLVTCIGISDAQKCLANGGGRPNGTALSYNGVSYSVANVESGQYPLWNFEHAYYLTGTQVNSVNQVANAAIVKAACDKLADDIYSSSLGSATDAGIAGATFDTTGLSLRSLTAGSLIK
jgi:hypothetical protein